ncbi:hypothetical protein VNO77_28229 [Canavalia gladiata]|uniref:Uncharacterized protein n=1 Tax=Canavalia gladiata TaxID=3824 RepID=A0AAN9L050_CANGL
MGVSIKPLQVSTTLACELCVMQRIRNNNNIVLTPHVYLVFARVTYTVEVEVERYGYSYVCSVLLRNLSQPCYALFQVACVKAMKFLFQCPCCSCFCFMKPKKGKPKVKEVKETKEEKIEAKIEEKIEEKKD